MNITRSIHFLSNISLFILFEIFLLMNKTMMCGGLVMAAPGTPLQVLIATLIMLCHLLVVLKLAPYESSGEDSSSFLSSITIQESLCCYKWQASVDLS